MYSNLSTHLIIFIFYEIKELRQLGLFNDELLMMFLVFSRSLSLVIRSYKYKFVLIYLVRSHHIHYVWSRTICKGVK